MALALEVGRGLLIYRYLVHAIGRELGAIRIRDHVPQDGLKNNPSVIAGALIQMKYSKSQTSLGKCIQSSVEWNRRYLTKTETMRYADVEKVGGKMTTRPVREEFIRRRILAGRVSPTEIQLKICDCVFGLPSPFCVESVCDLFVDYSLGITRATVFRAIQRMVDVGMLSEVAEQSGFYNTNTE